MARMASARTISYIQNVLDAQQNTFSSPACTNTTTEDVHVYLLQQPQRQRQRQRSCTANMDIPRPVAHSGLEHFQAVEDGTTSPRRTHSSHTVPASPTPEPGRQALRTLLTAGARPVDHEYRVSNFVMPTPYRTSMSASPSFSVEGSQIGQSTEGDEGAIIERINGRLTTGNLELQLFDRTDSGSYDMRTEDVRRETAHESATGGGEGLRMYFGAVGADNDVEENRDWNNVPDNPVPTLGLLDSNGQLHGSISSQPRNDNNGGHQSVVPAVHLYHDRHHICQNLGTEDSDSGSKVLLWIEQFCDIVGIDLHLPKRVHQLRGDWPGYLGLDNGGGRIGNDSRKLASNTSRTDSQLRKSMRVDETVQ